MYACVREEDYSHNLLMYLFFFVCFIFIYILILQKIISPQLYLL